MVTPSNQRRAFWKNKCREALAVHINEQLGLQVKPENVRLRPLPKDKYRWSVAESMQKDFQSNLSDGSLGRFQRIYEALQTGKLIEAMSVNECDPVSEEGHYEPAPDYSFTAKIQNLERDNQQIKLEYQEFQKKAQGELLDAEQNALLWKATAESYELKLNEMKEKVIPALDTLTLHLSTYFGSENSGY